MIAIDPGRIKELGILGLSQSFGEFRLYCKTPALSTITIHLAKSHQFGSVITRFVSLLAFKRRHMSCTRWPGWTPIYVREHQKPFTGGREDVGRPFSRRTDCYKVCFRCPPTHLQHTQQSRNGLSEYVIYFPLGGSNRLSTSCVSDTTHQS